MQGCSGGYQGYTAYTHFSIFTLIHIAKLFFGYAVIRSYTNDLRVYSLF